VTRHELRLVARFWLSHRAGHWILRGQIPVFFTPLLRSAEFPSALLRASIPQPSVAPNAAPTCGRSCQAEPGATIAG